LLQMVKGHRIERAIETEEFLELMKTYINESIECTHHTFFRLNNKQRKIFKCQKIRDLLIHEIPPLVGVQYNGCYAVFYRHMKRFIRMILNIDPKKIEVVTFYIVDQLPRLK